MNKIFLFVFFLSSLISAQVSWLPVNQDSGSFNSKAVSIKQNSTERLSFIGIEIPSTFAGADSISFEVKNVNQSNVWLPVYLKNALYVFPAQASRFIQFPYNEFIGADSLRIHTGGVVNDTVTASQKYYIKMIEF